MTFSVMVVKDDDGDNNVELLATSIGWFLTLCRIP